MDFEYLGRLTISYSSIDQSKLAGLSEFIQKKQSIRHLAFLGPILLTMEENIVESLNNLNFLISNMPESVEEVSIEGLDDSCEEMDLLISNLAKKELTNLEVKVISIGYS